MDKDIKKVKKRKKKSLTHSASDLKKEILLKDWEIQTGKEKDVKSKKKMRKELARLLTKDNMSKK